MLTFYQLQNAISTLKQLDFEFISKNIAKGINLEISKK